MTADGVRLLRATGPSLAEHTAAHGSLPLRHDLVAEVRTSGITGRGGAAFPTARKLQAMAARGVVIGNGSEGEPLSSKDELLLARHPHLVLDGLVATAHAVHARESHLVIGPRSELAVQQAIGERRDAGRIKVTVTHDRFVGGEASAVVNLLTTGNAMPTDRTVRLTSKGYRGRPTLVQNVETLAAIAVIARMGGEAFGRLGRADDPGTRLHTISGHVEHSGVIEAPGGATIRSVLAAARPSPIGAVLVGGYHGVWVREADLDHRFGPVGTEGAVPPGAGILVVLGRQACGLQAVAEITGYLAQESAGQCGPCINGLPALAGLMARLARPHRDRGLIDEIDRMLHLVEGRGACHHPDGTVKMVRSAMRAFADEVHEHRRGVCTAGHR